jgi:NTE family protein
MADRTTKPRSLAPVHFIPGDDPARPPRPGMGLCLSGGGYRAMLFHLGAIIRLNQAAILSRLRRISSVSGGSITAGVLGFKWKRLSFKEGVAMNLDAEVVGSVRQMADRTIDVSAIIGGVLLPGTVSDRIQAAYDRVLFHGATLQDLPSDSEGPRFVINATNLQTGVLFRFSKPFMADWKIGMVMRPKLKLAQAVAASSAFPPVLSPCVLRVTPSEFDEKGRGDLFKEPYNSEIVLADGGVYDNLGIETVWKDYQTVLVSDAGTDLPPEEAPKRDWLRQSIRVLEVIDNQVVSLRKRQLIAAYQDPARDHDGTYWGIRSHVKDYGLSDPIIPATGFKPANLLELAQTPTRLKHLDPQYQERLINWGYAICDTAIRAHVDKAIPKGTIPYPNSPI